MYEVRNKLDGKRYAVKKIRLANFRPDDCLKVNFVVNFNCCLINALFHTTCVKLTRR